jgi:nucleoside-diphosphate-sugar epimerase
MIYLTGSSGLIGQEVIKQLPISEIICHNRLWKKHMFLKIKDCDTVINCQAYGNHHEQTSLTEMLKANVHDLINMVEHSKNVKRFYNISTSSVTLPNQTGYSLTKALGELVINGQDSRFTNVRPYSVFGENERQDRFIPTIIRCLNSGETMKLVTDAYHDWIHVESFVDLMLNDIQHCGSGMSWSNLEIVRLLEEISGKTLKFEKVKSLRSYDTNKWVCPVKNQLKVNLYEGLKRVYEHHSK